MKRLLTTVLTILAALGLMIGLTGTASAAPPTTQTSTTTSGLLKLGNDLGVFTVEGFGGTTFDAATGSVNAPVIGNPEKSRWVIQRGGITLSKADGSSLSIRNIKYDTRSGLVTGVIDGERVALYTAEQIDETSADLYIHPEGGAILRTFVNFLGLPADGAHFGTSSLH